MPSLFTEYIPCNEEAGDQAQGRKSRKSDDQSDSAAGKNEFTTALRNSQRSLRMLIQQALDLVTLSGGRRHRQQYRPVLKRYAPVRAGQLARPGPAADRRSCHLMSAACLNVNCSRQWSATVQRVDDCPRRLHGMYDLRQGVSFFSTQMNRIGAKVRPDSMRLYQQGGYMPTARTDGFKKGKINKNWFLARMEERGLSMRRLSQQLGLDASAVSLILSGQRGATPSEVKEIAETLLVPATEIMRNLGIDVQDDVRKVPVAGHLAGDCTITLFAAGTEEYITGPADLPADAIVIQCRTVGSPLYQYDGWMIYLSAHQGDPAQKIGRMCIVAEESSGKMYLAQVERGYKTGLFNLVFTQGTARMMENVALSWASAVLWIRPRQ